VPQIASLEDETFQMFRSLFARLAMAAVALLLITLGAVEYTLTWYAGHQGGSPVDWPIRARVLEISTAAAAFALAVAFFVSRSLTRKVRRLKRIADGLAGTAPEPISLYEPDDDLGDLERSLTTVAQELHDLVDSLRFESARRQAILANMAEGVLAVDPDLRVTFCNQAFLRAVQFRGENFEGLSLLEMVRDPELHDLVRHVVSSGEPGKLRMKLSPATTRVFDVQATAIATAAGHGAIVIFHDITDLERLEQVRKDFVANVSHELRTPLAGIIGYAETLLDGALDDQANREQFVEIIRANAVRLGSIAADLLVLSELESGAESQEPETIAVRGVVESVLLTVEAEARERDVTLVRDSLEELYVSGSRLRLEQALLNLVANAIKFNRPGGEVRVGIRHDASAGVAITVSDTGVGIPYQDLPRIFERFYRVDKARSRQVGGTGLGLSIVKHVVERMKGTVNVESQLGRGTTFTIRLPAARRGVAV
jgi:two-component system phosphate regulon sensor histidine kinase PhoR